MPTLFDVPVLVIGLIARLNPLLVVTGAALVAGLAAGIDPLTLLAAFGKAFNDARYISVPFLILPVIGLLERAGLAAEARAVVGRLRALAVGRLLIAYLALRQATVALGRLSPGGKASMAQRAADAHVGLGDVARGLVQHDHRQRLRRRAEPSVSTAPRHHGSICIVDVIVYISDVIAYENR
jgi:uncharacterized membrane protein